MASPPVPSAAAWAPITAGALTVPPDIAARVAGLISRSRAAPCLPAHKLPLRGYLAAIAVFCNEVKGKSMLALSRDLGTSYKAAFVLAHKLREAMASEDQSAPEPRREREIRLDRRRLFRRLHQAREPQGPSPRSSLARNQNGKRQCVVVIRERDGHTLPGVFKSETDAVSFIRTRIAKGTEVHADESGAWNALHGRFIMKRINHQEAYSLMGACTNEAESFLSRIRRGEIGHHHHIAGIYLARFAQESAWREDHRRDSNGEQITAVAQPAMRNKPSVDFCGYWQRHKGFDV